MNKIILLILLLFSIQCYAGNKLTEDQCLASSIHYEARGEPMAGQRAVLEVILNRASKQNMSICAVVKQRKQFSFVTNKTKWLSKEKSEDILSVMDFVESPFDHDVVYFHNKSVNPKWNKQMRRVMRIKNHTFYKPKHNSH